MNLIILQLLLPLLGALLLSWGALIVSSRHFYRWWRDRYWKEPNDRHLNSDRLILNRYIEGSGMILLGLSLLYIGFSINTEGLEIKNQALGFSISQYLSLFFGGILFVFGILFTGNETFYKRFLKKYFKQEIEFSGVMKAICKRYMPGFAVVILGLIIIYMAIF